MSVTCRDFGLKNPEHHIVSQKYKDKYLTYQDDYRKQYGIFPELDIQNRPFTALWDEVYDAYKLLKKRGFYGAWYYHDYHGRFNSKFTQLYHAYKKEWSFLNTVGLNNRTFLIDIADMEPQEYIRNNLGYRKDKNGNYYEGTWENGKLIYGLVYLSQTNTVLVGEIHYNAKTECHGVSWCFSDQIKNCSANTDQKVRTVLGISAVEENRSYLYQSTGFFMDGVIKNGNFLGFDAYIGNYDEGYENGRFYNKEVSDEIRITWAKFKDGGIVSNANGFHIFLHLILALYMIPYYIMKFTYFLPFYLIYKAVQKSNWQ